MSEKLRVLRTSPAAPGIETDIASGILTTILGLYAIIGGILTLIGWAIPYPPLTDWAGRGISMFPNAAVCGISAGLALMILNHREKQPAIHFAAVSLALFTAAIGGLSLFEHISGINLGIDEFLFEGTWGQAASTSPMRIGVPASTSYLLLGTAFLLATGGTRRRRTAAFIAVIPVAIASLSIVGYWFGATQLYGVARYTGIAWQTATIILALGIGLIAALRDCGIMAFLMRQDAGGLIARRLLLPMVILPILFGWIRIIGSRYGLYDDAFGTAARTVLEIFTFLGFLWWCTSSISRHASDAHAATQSLKASDQRFTRFMQALPGLAWIKDTGGRYVFANEAATTAFGKTPDELHGLTDADFLPEDSARRFMENDLLALHDPAGIQFVEKLLHPDGTPHSSLVSKFPITDSTGTPVFVGGIAIDITARLRAEEELREAGRKKDEFLATLAHELRNPLSPILLSVEICRSPGVDGEKRSYALDIVERQVRQMSRLLEDLLDAARISHGKVTLRPERVGLASVVSNAVETSRPLREKALQNLEIHLPPAPVILHADPVRLEQIFGNLLNNAAKYAGYESHVTLTATAENGSVAISIRDNGPGIPPDRLSDIFEMFSQVKSGADGPQGGLGIGLSLVRGLVELHNGSIEARCEGIGKGTEFIVRLPIHPDSSHAETTGPAVETLPAAKSLRILVADDLTDSADTLTAYLLSSGHEVRTAYDGSQALAIAGELKPHIAFLDIGMPNLDGLEVCRRIRATAWGGKTTIVAITGWSQATDRKLTAEAGFDHHFPKPVEPGALREILASTPSEPMPSALEGANKEKGFVTP